MVQNTPFFEQLKPRLKKQVLDAIFKNFYEIFRHIFEDCGNEFRREIFCNAKFTYLGQDVEQEEENIEWIINDDLPVIEQSGKMPRNVYFILSGQAHIMNKEGMYEYGVIQEGGYFGDISVLLNRPSEYAYYYNPYIDKPILMLSLDANEFLNICNKYPLAKDILTDRAYKRREMFENYKSIVLLKYMKAIRKHPNIVLQKELLSSNNHINKSSLCNAVTQVIKLKSMKNIDLQLQIFDAFIKQYEYNRFYKKL